jgi:Ca2+/Na+ antiporter
MAKGIKFSLKTWFIILGILIFVASMMIWRGNDLMSKIGIELIGASIFVLLLSVIFRKRIV